MSHRWGAGTAPSLEHVTETLQVQVLAGEVVCIKPVLNWAHICFANIVQVIRQTWKKFGKLSLFLIGQWTVTKLCSGSKNLHSICSGNIHPVWQTCLWVWKQRELSFGWGRNDYKEKENGWQCRYFTRFRGNWPICWLVGGAALSLGPRMIL